MGCLLSLSWESNSGEECLRDPTVVQACGIYLHVESACADNGLFVIAEDKRRSAQSAIKLVESNLLRGKTRLRELDEHTDINSKISGREGLRPGLHHYARRTLWFPGLTFNPFRLLLSLTAFLGVSHFSRCSSTQHMFIFVK